MTHRTLTRNQHYFSQAEQRLNSANPNAKPKNQRIYSFVVDSAEPRTFKLERDDGVKVSSNLSFLDLFSFDVFDRNSRLALEEQFGRYESQISAHTTALLDKLATADTDLKREVVDIFAAKLLNFLRNPHSVKKVLNTIGAAADYTPTDPNLRNTYERVLNGSRPQEPYACQAFQLAPEDYRRWIRALFLLLSPADAQGHTFLDQVIKNLLEESFVMVQVHRYTSTRGDHFCLLSDRGFTIRAEKPELTCFEFNLTSQAFVQFAIGDFQALAEPHASPEIVAALKARREIQLFHKTDDLKALSLYNATTIHQCRERVYCASKTFHH